MQLTKKKLGPSKLYTQDSSSQDQGATGLGPGAKHLAVLALEEEIGAELVQKYEERLKQNYDLDIDPLYSTWKNLKEKSRSHRAPLADISNQDQNKTPLQEVLQIPQKTSKKTKQTIQGTATLPKHLSGSEVIAFLEERQTKREMEEKLKEECKEKREERRKEEQKEKEKCREQRAEERTKQKEFEKRTKKAEKKHEERSKKAKNRDRSLHYKKN